MTGISGAAFVKNGMDIPATTDWIMMLILLTLGDELGRGPDNGSTKEIQHSIDQTGQHRHGRNRNDDGELSSKKNEISNHVDPYGKSDDGIITVDIGLFEPRQIGSGASVAGGRRHRWVGGVVLVILDITMML